jgi:hypothetical protein
MGLIGPPRLAILVVGLVVVGLVLVVLPEHLGHAVGGFAGDFRGDVAIGVHGQSDRAVAEDFHDDPSGHALGQQEARRGVAEIVQSDRW